MTAVRTSSAELAIRMECLLGEGPRWDAGDGSLIFVDVIPGKLHRLRGGREAEPESSLVRTTQLDQPLGAANPVVGGSLVLAMRDGIYLSDADGGQPRLLVAVEADRPANRMNDAACDPQGRLWAGTMSFEAEPGEGTLYRIDPGGSATAIIGGLTISNGLGWSPDGRRMYFIDSPTRRIDVLDFDAEDGTVHDRRCFLDVSDVAGVPDGLTMDTDGGIWVAFWGGAQVRRYRHDAVLTDIVQVPVPQPTACAFGGPDGQDLYITSARLGLDQSGLQAAELSGSLFACRPGYQGSAAQAFGTN